LFNKQKEMNMMKQKFLSLIAICVFCLAVLPVQADDPIEKKFKVYPNPVNRGAVLTFEMPVDRGEMTIFLYNSVGKVVQRFKTYNKKVEFNAPDVSGIYLLRFIEQQKVIAVEKIVVKE
jgi:hypothetical protein